MNRITNIRIRFRLLAAFVLCLASVNQQDASAQEKSRIWVDSEGRFSIEATLLRWTDDTVVLLREDDGGEVTLSSEKLSQRDRRYVDGIREEYSSDNVLRTRPPEPPEIDPLPPLRLASSDQPVTDRSVLDIRLPTGIVSRTSLPESLPADRSPWKFEVPECRMPVRRVDFNSLVSLPFPMITRGSSGTESVSMGMSISDPTAMTGASRQQLVRFDVEDAKPRVVFDHDETIKMLDHNPENNQSLLLVGFNSLGQGGELAIATGWDSNRIQLTRRCAFQCPADGLDEAKIRWARWIDPQHVMLVWDRSVGVWNLNSGKQIYHIDGLDPRATPAISGGRRYLAIPFSGGVELVATETCTSLGQILVEDQIPGVQFSPQGNMLAINTTRRLRVWDMTAAALAGDVQSRRSYGTESPVWIDSDLLISGTGVLVSLFRGVPIWKYDIAGTEMASVGKSVALFLKSPKSELSIVNFPHSTAATLIGRIDASPIGIDQQQWQIPGRSVWESGRWVDRNVRISSRSQLKQ